MKKRYSIRISKNTVFKIVNEIVKYSKGDIEIKQEYNPECEGYLVVDDKFFSVGGEKKPILIANDSSRDIVHLEKFQHMVQHKIDEFFDFIDKHIKYPLRAITTDLYEMLVESIVMRYGDRVLH